MTVKSYIRLLIATLCLVVMPCAANANYVPLTCDNAGGVAGGELYDADSACTYSGIQHIFSVIVCNFVVIVNGIMDNVYCSIQYAIKDTLAVLLTLYIAIFGLQILMGTAQLNGGEIVIRLLKIAGVWTFCTQSTWAIGLILQFFMAIAAEGVLWVTGPLMPGNGNVISIYNFLDTFIYNFTAGLLLQANAKVIGFFMMMLVVDPGIASMAFYWLWSTIVMLGKTLLSFVSCLAMLAFLISLSPFFLSFLLFKVTYHFFEAWLKYMISYALRIVIVFAIIGMWAAITTVYISFFNDLSNIVFPYDKVTNMAAVNTPVHDWGICTLDYGNNIMGPAVQCIDSACPNQKFNPATCPGDIPAVIGPDKIIEEFDFLYYLVYHMVSLVLVGYAFKKLMDFSDNLADMIVGPTYMPVFGPGWRDIGGMDAAQNPTAPPGAHRQQAGSIYNMNQGVMNMVNKMREQYENRPNP